MKPETEAKAIVAIIISLLAFGCGSGVGIVMGIYQDNSSVPQINNTNQEMPQIPSTKNVNTHTQSQQNSSPNNEVVYVDTSSSNNNPPSITGNNNNSNNST